MLRATLLAATAVVVAACTNVVPATVPPSGPTSAPTASPTTAPTGADGPMAALMAHVPAAFNVGCHEVTTLSAGEVIAVSCETPSGKGYVTYILFDTSPNLQDKFFGDLEYFAPGVTGTDCANGPCLVAKVGSTGLTEGRLFANTYTGIDPNGVISYWFDDSLLIEAGIVTYDTTFAQLYDLALDAGPVP